MDATVARDRLLAERERTLRRLSELTGDYQGFVEASRDTNADDEHDPEGATIAFERSQVGALVRETHDRLREVDAALARLDAATYGVCERCGRPIPAERLEVRPAARTCVACSGRSPRR
ncbi:TraR/DksA family transcriptional regulator [Nocardioides sp. DS6]|uniref:TraR/DksA family transcriptional regulator n=1 Tax=Nocardioides eburneus TaxID=3231482 RepID=A0ABV3STK9_9ACTN